MNSLLPPSCVPYLASLVRAIVPLLVVCGLCPNARGQGNVSIPQQQYFLGLAGLYDGEYLATSQVMGTCVQGAIKNPAVGGFWIDSICYQTILGECAYHAGNYAAAQGFYEAALQLLINFNNWMITVQFPPAVVPAPPQSLKPIPWYVTTRATVPGGYPLQMTIAQPAAQLAPGALVVQPVLIPIYASEIVRCSCLAIRRYRELLGPACPHSKTTQRLVQVLGQRPALPNHWSEAWVDTELGLALAAAGKTEQARKTLAQAERAMGFDHQFTGHVLLMQGLLDMESGEYKSAHRNFLEASWAAANYNDFGVVEESLHYSTVAHFLSNGRVPYPLLAPAVAWAATGVGQTGVLVQLNTSLLLDSADNAAQCNQPALATGFLTQATVLASGTNMLTGRLGARMNHLKSLVAYQMGNTVGGDVALAAAMTFQTGGSLWLYHLAAADILWNTRDLTGFTERQAVDLYSIVLRDPLPTDWLINPLESLSLLFIPHLPSFENWFEAALARRAKDHELALTITDMARRHRFLTTLEHGGRLLNLRWLMEAPEKALDQNALMQRQALAARFPAYVEKSQRVRKLRSDLRKLPLMIEDDQEVAEQQSEMLTELASLSGEQEVLLRQISVGNEPANLVFPPLRSFKQMQESLSEGQSLLVFFDTLRYTYSFLIEKDKYNYNEVKPPKRFRTDITRLLQTWGNYNQNREMKLEELTSNAWQAPAQQIMNVLVKNSKADFTKTTDELIIVPDSVLWYVPFEAMPVAADHNEPLINKVRIRYAPTIGLAVGETRRRRPKGNLAVVLGKLYPGDDAAVVDREFEDLRRSLKDAEAIRGRLPAHGAIFSSLFDRMIVMNEVPPSAGFDWSPLAIDNKTPGGTLGQWLSLPFDGPDQIILPAFRTPAERGLAKSAQGANGYEMFLSVCGLMGTGARTVLISRWRTGGQSSVDLVKEFVQELPHTTASDAWQRSVQVVTHHQVNPAEEPRLKKLPPDEEPPSGKHPFFWAGYLLADTGALPMTHDEEEEAAEQVLVAAPAGAKPAAPNENAKVMEEDAGAAGAKQDGKQAAAPADPLGAKVQAAGVPPANQAAGAEKSPPAKTGKTTAPVRPPRDDQKPLAPKPKGKRPRAAA